jgi:uncharacterized membrane protein YgaE (UPF0421/DUF939 family)
VLVISAAYEPGLVIKKSLQRGVGTIISLLLASLILQVMQFNFRFTPLVLVIIVAITYAFYGRIHHAQSACIAMFVFISSAFLPNENSVFQEAVDRIICTIIGLAICLSMDYLLFSKFKYSKKNYALLQRDVCNVMQKMVNQAVKHKGERISDVKMQIIRENFSSSFAKITNSSESIDRDHSYSSEVKLKIKNFENYIWKLRSEVSAINYCAMFSKDYLAMDKHLSLFTENMVLAKENFISIK